MFCNFQRQEKKIEGKSLFRLLSVESNRPKQVSRFACRKSTLFLCNGFMRTEKRKIEKDFSREENEN
jgi:hypothetical protein